MSQVGTWTFEIPPNHGFEFLECVGLDVELPFEVGSHFVLHLVNLLEGKCIPIYNTLGRVGINIVADDLRSNRECRDGMLDWRIQMVPKFPDEVESKEGSERVRIALLLTASSTSATTPAPSSCISTSGALASTTSTLSTALRRAPFPDAPARNWPSFL